MYFIKIVPAIFLASVFSQNFAIAADEPLSIKGYADVQYKMNRGSLDVTDTTAVSGAKNSFLVNQGALYLSKSLESGKVFLDLPFSTDTSTAGASTRDFVFAKSQAQAFVENKYDFGLSWRAGQFDTIYGFEGNDTIDLLATRQGLVYAILPVTHLGVLANYAIGPMTVSLLFGNANQLNVQTSSDAPEMGGKVAWSNDSYRASGGVLVNKKDGNYTVGSQTESFQNNMIVDLLAGATFDSFKIDLGYDIVQPGQRKVLASSGAVEDKKNTQMIFAQTSYDLNANITPYVRFENVKEDASNTFATAASANGNGSDLSRITGGVRHLITKELQCKAAINFNTVKVSADSTAKSANYVDAEFAVLYSF